MNVITRGIRNAFRNLIRTVSIVVILGLVIGLSLSMLVANRAVGQKIKTVKANIGNTVSISPAGARGFEGGGTALTAAQLSKVEKLVHVDNLTKSLSDRLTSDNTTLKSAVEAGNLGQRFSQNNGTGFSGGAPPEESTRSGSNTPNSLGASSGLAMRTFTPPVTVNGTTAPSDLSAGGGTFTLKSGQIFSSTSKENVALVGSTLASKNSLKVGSTFTAYGATIKVVGIFDAGNTFSNNQVIMPLATVQALSKQTDAVTSAVANVDSIENVPSVTTAAKNALGSAADVTNAAESADEIVSPLMNIQKISLYSLVGAVAAGAAIILLTMVMIVRERRREIGVIKAIGASNIKVVGQFMSEAVTLTLLGAVIGIVMGVAAASPITKMLVNNSSSSSTSSQQSGPGAPPTTTGPAPNSPMSQTQPRPSGAVRGARENVNNVRAVVGWNIILYGLGAALVIALIGSSIAAFFIAKIRPAEVMRAE